MVESESFKNQLKGGQSTTVKSAEASLITLERAQKLDLLIHLITNLRQSLVICGPEGIGKTTLLAELNQRKSDVWSLLTIEANSRLSYESVQDQIEHFVTQNTNSAVNQDISSILAELDKQNQKIVVIFEAAGQLVPGLVSMLIQYATISPSMRLIFSLTHDELNLKTQSDQTIDGCHFIEMPSLSESQCGLFLQYLSRQANAIVPFEAINERMVAKLYQKTHGIPGKIMTELPTLSNYSANHSLSWGRLAVVAIIVSAGISLFISDDEQISKVEINKTLLLPEPEVVEISSPVVQQSLIAKVNTKTKQQENSFNDLSEVVIESTSAGIQDIKENDLEPDIFKQPLLKKQTLSDVIKVAEVKEKIEPIIQFQVKDIKKLESVEKTTVDKVIIDKNSHEINTLEQPLIVAKAKKKIVQTNKKKRITPPLVEDDRQWLLAQSEKQYTIQLMALSTRESVAEFLQNNKALKPQLKYFVTSKQGKKVFVLIYGAFNSFEAASKKMQTLPVKYRKSWVRRIGILQKSIK